MLISIPAKYSVMQIMGYLKGKGSLIVFDRHSNLKYKHVNKTFLVKRLLCRYGREKKAIAGIHKASIRRRSNEP